MPALADTGSHYIEQFESLDTSRDGDPEGGFSQLRGKAMARFAELGFPTTSDEDWRFTNVAPIARIPFRLAPPGLAGIGRAELKPFQVSGACRLVFINGYFSPDLSSLVVPHGVRVGRLAEALRSQDSTVRNHLGKYLSFERHAFAALNTAFLRDGAVVEIAAGAIVEEPLHLLFVSAAGAEPIVSHPRTLVLAGAASQARLVESYVGLGSGTSLTNAVTEIVAAEGAILDHYRVQRETPETFHVSATQLTQHRSSTVSSLNAVMGGLLVRNDVTARLDGEGCDCTLNGLFVADGSGHVDNHLRVEHAQPHCTSWEYYKGILDGKAKGVFTGRIVVFEGAQKTDAKQTNKNLLLSEEAQIDTKPQLEIFADDVKCTHGATIGQIDSDALFYLRARGISEEVARSLLIYAFAAESLGQIKIEPLRRQLEAVLLEQLPGSSPLRGVLA